MDKLKVGQEYQLTHEYTGKQYKVFRARLTNIIHRTTRGGVTELVFVADKHIGKVRFRYPINPKKRYGIIKVEKIQEGGDIMKANPSKKPMDRRIEDFVREVERLAHDTDIRVEFETALFDTKTGEQVAAITYNEETKEYEVETE